MVQQVRKSGAFRVMLGGVVCVLALTANAQEPCDQPTDKKVLKALEEAAKAKDARQRHAKLLDLVEEKPDCIPCQYRLGMSAYDRLRSGSGGAAKVIEVLEVVRDQCPDMEPELGYYLGSAYAAADRNADAFKAYDAFLLSAPPSDSRARDRYMNKVQEVERLLPELRFHADFYADDRPLLPRSVEGVNTDGDEYLPMFSHDNELLFFTRVSKHKERGAVLSRTVEELVEARRQGVREVFKNVAPLPQPFNTGDGYGGVTVSLNNKELYVTICKTDGNGYRNCDIFCSRFSTSRHPVTKELVYEWGALEDLGPNVNTPDGWESQPTLSVDGRTLYFATVRRSSRATDIYQSTRNDQGEWGKAVPMPGPINTDGDEKAPFMHTDSRTMYFAARPPRDASGREDVGAGHRGAGGYDIFYSRMDDAGNWSQPKNIGAPINTPQDDHGLIVSTDGRTAYFASGRFAGAGGLDIYGFDLPERARPADVVIVKGTVTDGAGKVITDAHVDITYASEDRTERIAVDKSDGSYAAVVDLKPGSDAVVTVKKPGHVFDSRVFTHADAGNGGVAKADMEVAKIQVGKSYRINDINFATNSAELEKASLHILGQLLVFLKENPTVRIEVQGHTDNVGATEPNMVLSNARAHAVREYLINAGIATARLGAKGFGPTKPVADNGTPEGRAQNRRTEFVITGR